MYQSIKEIILPIAQPNDKGAMRSFALGMSIFLPLLFTLILPWLFDKPLAYWPLVVSSCFMILYFAYPKGIYYPYYIWIIIASVLAWINTRVILALVFYLVLTPIGVFMKLLGKLQYKKQLTQQSAWVQLKHTDARKDKKRLEEPF